MKLEAKVNFDRFEEALTGCRCSYSRWSSAVWSSEDSLSQKAAQ